MSTRYAVRLRCRVDRRCPRCRAEYRTAVPRELEAAGDTPEDAARAASRRVSRELASEADPHPCPSCGRLPTDVVNRRQRLRHAVVTAIGLALLLVVWAVGLSGGWTGLLAAVVILLTAVGHATIVMRSADADPEPTPREDVELLEEGNPHRPRPMPAARTGWHAVGVFGTLAAALVALTPAVAARRDGDTLFVRPGEPVRVAFAESFECEAEDWAGVPKVTVRNPRDFPDRVPDVRAESRRPGEKRAEDRAGRNTVHPWADLTAPEDPALAAAPLRLRVDLEVTYTAPDRRGSGGKQNLTASRDVTLEVAPTTAAGRVRAVSVGSVGLFFSGLMVLAAGLFLRTLGVPDPGDKPVVEVDEVAVAPADRDGRPTASGRSRTPSEDET